MYSPHRYNKYISIRSISINNILSPSRPKANDNNNDNKKSNDNNTYDKDIELDGIYNMKSIYPSNTNNKGLWGYNKGGLYPYTNPKTHWWILSNAMDKYRATWNGRDEGKGGGYTDNRDREITLLTESRMKELRDVTSDLSEIAQGVGEMGFRGAEKARRQMEDEGRREEARARLTVVAEEYMRLARDCMVEFIRGYKEGKEEKVRKARGGWSEATALDSIAQ